MTYNILIVDDEKIFLDYMENSMDWQKLNCRICGRAYDGTEALKKIEDLQPHIILMDIQMSRMDGLEVCEQLNRDNTPRRVIIVSAYEAFHFAKRAIKLGVFDYLTKPFDKEELTKTLKRCIEDMEKERENHLLIENMAANDREKQLDSLLSSGILPPSLTSEVWVRDREIIVSVLKIPEKRDSYFYESLRCALSQFMDFDDLVHSVITGESYNNLTITHFVKKESPGNKLLKDRFLFLLREGKATFIECVAIGSQVIELGKLQESFQEAMIIMENHVKMDKKVVTVHDLKELKEEVPYFSGEDIHFLIQLFENKNYNELDSFIEQLFLISQNQMVNFEYMLSLYMSFVSYALNHYKKKGLGSREYKDIITTMRKELNLCTTKEEISNLLVNSIYDFLSESSSQEIPRNNHLVNRIEAFLQDNFRKNGLSVRDIEEVLFFENSYIRRVYKVHVGKTIMQRLEELRLIESKKLLRDTPMTIAEIAEQVGYSSQYYFSRRFKIDCSMTPTDYRKRNNKPLY